MSDSEWIENPGISRLREGLDKLAAVSRAELWAATRASGLNPAQAQVLNLLAGRRKAGLRIREISAHLGVSQPAMTDTVTALEHKRFVERRGDPADARATIVHVTESGNAALQEVKAAGSAMAAALSGLALEEQADLLKLTVKLIRSLQISGAIPVQRMCANCAHFRPNFHDDADLPHHCNFVNAAFGDRQFRLDCSDHETAGPAAQSANWAAFHKGPASLQALISKQKEHPQ